MDRRIVHSTQGSTLGDLLEKILDKGVVIAGDISIAVADVELLTIRIRLVVASVEKAMEMGIDWWTTDPTLSSLAQKNQKALNANERIEVIEKKLEKISDNLDRL
ncbi:MAG: gas vesicle protein [Bacillus sp. (in: firmicutes)]